MRVQIVLTPWGKISLRPSSYFERIELFPMTWQVMNRNFFYQSGRSIYLTYNDESIS